MNVIEAKRKNKLMIFWMDKLINNKCTLREASEITGYNMYYLSSLKKKYAVLGKDCFIHGNKDKIPHNKTPEALVQKILAIYAQPEFEDCNFKVFQEFLSEYYDIDINYNTLRGIMKQSGIMSPRKHKTKKRNNVHTPRLRREHEGDLIQLDGTPYEWFKHSGDYKKYCMHGSIDDATGKLTAIYFCENECMYGVFKLFEITARRHGLPREAYMDRAAWACVTPKLKHCLSITEQLAGLHEKRTQVQRALAELNIHQILAWSPQAKGRVERMWQTIQDRYPLWAWKRGIKNMDEANSHIDEFIDYFNKHFAKLPHSQDDYWRPAPPDLDQILCAQFPHKTNVNGCFKFHSYDFVVRGAFVANKNFTLCIRAEGIYARMQDGTIYPIELIDDDIGYVYCDQFPDVIKNIIHDNIFAFAKEVSA